MTPLQKTQIQTDRAPRPGGAYSQGIRAGGLVFVAGQGPIDPTTGSVTGQTIEEQTAKTFENIAGILAAAGVALEDVVKVTVHLSDLELFKRYDTAYSRIFGDPKPVRTTVGSQLLGIMIEADVIAISPDAGAPA